MEKFICRYFFCSKSLLLTIEQDIFIQFGPIMFNGPQTILFIMKDISMHDLAKKKAFVSDMDGVIYHGNNLLPGAKEFVNWLNDP